MALERERGVAVVCVLWDRMSMDAAAVDLQGRVEILC